MICAQLRKSVASFLGKSNVSLFLPVNFFSTVAAPSVSELLPHKNPGNTDSLTLFLKENGFSDTHLERMFKGKPKLRFANVETSVKPKINVFQEFGFSRSEIVNIMTNQPEFMRRSSKCLRLLLYQLHNLFGSNEKALKFLLRDGWIFSSDMGKALQQNVQFLKITGVSTQRMDKIVVSHPRVFLCNHEKLKRSVEKLEVLGVNPSSNMFIYALRVLISLSRRVWDLKLETLKGIGFTESEALIIFRTAPMVFNVSVDKFKRVVEVVLATKRYDLSSIVTNPFCFSYSVEKRLKPRFQVFEILEKRQLIHQWPSLSYACLSDEKFHKSFVAQYPEIFTGITCPAIGRKQNEKPLVN